MRRRKRRRMKRRREGEDGGREKEGGGRKKKAATSPVPHQLVFLEVSSVCPWSYPESSNNSVDAPAMPRGRRRQALVTQPLLIPHNLGFAEILLQLPTRPQVPPPSQIFQPSKVSHPSFLLHLHFAWLTFHPP